jgi:hypothetical protein
MKTNHVSNHLTRWSAIVGTFGIGQHRNVLGNKFTLSCALAFIFLASAWQAAASDPVGIYAFVDKVVLEPSDGSPERIQVWGGFALAEGRGEQYAAPQRGYMYFTLKPGEEETCRKEWNDLKSMAGTGQIVAFGTRYKAKGTIRKPADKPEKPDAYPTGFGLTKINRTDYAPVKGLLELQKTKPATGSSKLPTAKS